MNRTVRALFPVTERAIYLNHAAVSPPPLTTIEAIQDYKLMRFPEFWLCLGDPSLEQRAIIVRRQLKDVSKMYGHLRPSPPSDLLVSQS